MPVQIHHNVGTNIKKDGTRWDISKFDTPCRDMPVTSGDREIHGILSNKMQSKVNKVLTSI